MNRDAGKMSEGKDKGIRELERDEGREKREERRREKRGGFQKCTVN